MRYLLDTCVVSEVVKKEPSPHVLKWLSLTGEQALYLSVLSLGEINSGISRLPSSKRKQRLHSWLNHDLKNRFEGRILEVTLDVALLWGEIQGTAWTQGTKIPVMDSLIAATALLHEMTVVTRNEKDLQGSGVAIFNPWLED